MNNQRNTSQELRNYLDGGDSFMRSGHQILVIRSVKKVIPSWAKSDAKIRKILLRSFPKLKTDKKQAMAAGRWARVIHLYFRMGQTRGQIAGEMGLNYATTDTMIRNIKRAAAGFRANGKGELRGKRGRPRKTVPV